MADHWHRDGNHFGYAHIEKYLVEDPEGKLWIGKPFGWLGHMIVKGFVYHEMQLKMMGYKVGKVMKS